MSAVRKLNIVDIENGLEELANKKLSPLEYGKELIALFGSAATLKRLGTSKANTSDFENGLLWREKLHYVPCYPGELNSIIDAVKKSDRTLKAKVRLVVVNDGSHILVYDRKYDELTDSTIDTIKDEPQLFLPLAGQEGFRRKEESEVDIKATGKLAKVYDALIERNPEWLEGDKRHDLNHFMTQIIFCLFAEDTGIFPKDILTKALKNRAGNEGEHANQVLTEIFSVLDLNGSNRRALPSWLAEFPYVNGGLFSGETLIPVFTSKAYRYLLEAASLDWKHINPDILGSSIQAIVDKSMRGNLGMHYTSVPNILKTIEPLFLNELRDELLKARHSKKQINAFLERLSKIVIFDPACGSGNFLVIAYRELRKLELQALDALRDLDGGASLAFGFNSVISLSNFYGIEYADFAAETARLALWIAEYQQNARFRTAFGTEIPALPLRDSGNIYCGNALRVDWSEYVKVDNDELVFIVGNPPYLGTKNQSPTQKEDMKLTLASKIKKYKSLDYVCAWFVKATEFIFDREFRFAFVATSSICQGAQASTLWPWIYQNRGVINFAHLPFKWRNNAASNAGVTCIVIGIWNKDEVGKSLIFPDGTEKNVNKINSYLLPMDEVAIKQSSKRIDSLPSLLRGSSPTDDGNLILTEEEKSKLISLYPELENYIFGLIGSNEVIKNTRRYVLYLKMAPKYILELPEIKRRLTAVKEFRLLSPKSKTKEQAYEPQLFGEDYHKESVNTLVIPVRSSENRPYLTPNLYNNGEIITNLAFALYDAELWHFSIVSSRLHVIWIDTVCGKLETRRTYSNTLGWNIFPVPCLTQEQIEALNNSARKILLARENSYPKTIAELYAKDSMPDDLKKAHHENDVLLESYYKNVPFEDDEERLTYLFNLYSKTQKESHNEQ
tara:strand:+ start:1517 stop:4216 length:2700 start_codon:yes stop_codon:yes gene_type:complete